MNRSTRGISTVFRAASAALIGSALLLLSTSSNAVEFSCSVAGDARHLRLDIPGEQYLCEVSVTPEGGERKVLWYANNGTLFCSEKADALITKYQEVWGFTCDAWPHDDDLEQLSEAQRRRLDQDLRQWHASEDNNFAAIRVITGPVDTDGQSLIAIQRVTEGSAADSVSVYIDSGVVDEREVAQWQRIAQVDDLLAVIDPLDAIVTRSIINRIGPAGGLTVSTVIQGNTDANATPTCRGQQNFAVDEKGGLSALAPHRYSCDADAVKP